MKTMHYIGVPRSWKAYVKDMAMSSAIEGSSELPNPRRIVTGHDDQGKAIVLKDSPVPLKLVPRGVRLGVLWKTDTVPANNCGDFDPITVATKDLTNENGSILRIVDFNPNNANVSNNVEDIMF